LVAKKLHASVNQVNAQMSSLFNLDLGPSLLLMYGNWMYTVLSRHLNIWSRWLLQSAASWKIFSGWRKMVQNPAFKHRHFLAPFSLIYKGQFL